MPFIHKTIYKGQFKPVIAKIKVFCQQESREKVQRFRPGTDASTGSEMVTMEVKMHVDKLVLDAATVKMYVRTLCCV